MRRRGSGLAGLCLAMALAAAGAAPAKSTHSRHTVSHRTHAAASRRCCRAPAGTKMEVELAEPVSSRHAHAGDNVALRLSAPLIVGGELLIPQGTPAVGRVVSASRPGLGGKPAKLVLAARYVDVDGRHVPLEGLQLARAGRNNALMARAVGLTGLAFAPLGFAGLAVHGGNVDLPAGLTATARLSSDVFLPPRGRAAAPPPSPSAAEDQDEEHAAIQVPPPPAGKGQVVFFRRRSILSLGQWFKVRENRKAICKLTNGAYCIVATEPGTHTYTATFEPELKDHLTLQVDPGDTYFVEGTVSRALLVGAADLSPSSREVFDATSKHLKPAPPLAPNGADDGPDDKPDAAGVRTDGKP